MIDGVMAIVLVSAAVGGASVTYGTGMWSENLGNHRAVIRVVEQSPCVLATLPWRRRDDRPEEKAVWVTDSAGTRLNNVVALSVSRESGVIALEPSSGPGVYYVYYLPYVSEGWWAFPSVRYVAPEDTADPAWIQTCGLKDEARRGEWPQATVEEIQAINDFNRFDPMEIPATPEELVVFLKTHPGTFLLFPEDRRTPIRMEDEIPVRWLETGPNRPFRGEAMRGEFYAFQIGLFAVEKDLDDVHVVFSDWRSDVGATLPASAMRCINTGGVDCLGQPLVKRVGVKKGRIQALWCGIQVPDDADAGDYRGNVRVQCSGQPVANVDVTLSVSPSTIAEAGDHDLWRHARLRWLDSSIGLDDHVFDPYVPVAFDERKQMASVLGRRIRLAPGGLPQAIESTFTDSVDGVNGDSREILASAMEFNVNEAGQAKRWDHGEGRIVSRDSGAVVWETESRTEGLARHVKAKIECDGYVNYWITLRAERDREIDDVVLEMPLAAEVARFMVGLGRKGGLRPRAWDWVWDVARSNNYVWLGDVNAGLQCKLKHITPQWDLYGLQGTGPYKDWSGQGRGGCSVREEGSRVVFRAFTGPLSLQAGQVLHFNFALLVTPLKPLDKGHWDWRYYHASVASPVKTVADMGAKVINLHQGDALNPHINYPFKTTESLAAYAQEAHARDMRVKIYYTVRELSNYAEEFWALKSLGDEVFRAGPGFKLADHFLDKNQRPANWPQTGSSWLCEHAITGYVPAWHQPLGNGHCDAAVAQQGLSRWHNYYLEGLNYLVRNVGIDGLYLDGVGYDREIMKRVRKVLQRAGQGCLIDFHSGNNFDPNYGLNNVVGQYMELLPCVDSIWFGEGFDYNETWDYWLVEVSGIPFGLFGEMLHGGGNPWRGMVFGMTNRLGWCGDPRPIWAIWDLFGIRDATLLGFWDPADPVSTGRNDVLATTYVKKDRPGRALIALGSWAETPVSCRMKIDFSALGLHPRKAHLYAPPIDGFQSEKLFGPKDEIPVSPGKGWLLFLDEDPRTLSVAPQSDPHMEKTSAVENQP